MKRVAQSRIREALETTAFRAGLYYVIDIFQMLCVHEFLLFCFAPDLLHLCGRDGPGEPVAVLFGMTGDDACGALLSAGTADIDAFADIDGRHARDEVHTRAQPLRYMSGSKRLLIFPFRRRALAG